MGWHFKNVIENVRFRKVSEEEIDDGDDDEVGDDDDDDGWGEDEVSFWPSDRRGATRTASNFCSIGVDYPGLLLRLEQKGKGEAYERSHQCPELSQLDSKKNIFSCAIGMNERDREEHSHGMLKLFFIACARFGADTPTNQPTKLLTTYARHFPDASPASATSPSLWFAQSMAKVDGSAEWCRQWSAEDRRNA